MLRWTSLLLLAGPVILLVYALRRRRGHESSSLRTALIIYGFCAAAPLVFAVLWRLDATRVGIELHGIAFRTNGGGIIRKEVRERRQGSGRLVIGDRATPNARTFGTLAFRPGSGGAEGTLRIELPPRAQRAGLVASESNGILGAELIEDGDRICVAGNCWTVDDGTFTNGKHVAQIPSRVAEIPGLGWAFPLPFARPVTAGLRTWSLDALAHEGGVIPLERRVRSFVAHVSPDARLRLVSLDDDVHLERAGKRLGAAAVFGVADGERLAFYTLPGDAATFAAPGITERRSMVYRAGTRSFVLDLDTPEVHTVTVPELRALELANEKDALAQGKGTLANEKDALVEVKAAKKRVALSMGDAQLVDRSLYFAGLSESVAVEANALLELSRLFPRDASSAFRVISPRGPVDAKLGSVQWIGSSDLAAIRFDVFRPPLLLLAIGAILLLFKAVAAHAARLSTAQMLLAGAIELLCGWRLLLGYRVWSMPPHRMEAAELATVAWMALPWMFLVACASLRDRAAAMPALAGLTFSAVFCAFAVEGPTKWVWVVCHLLAIVAALARDEKVHARVALLSRRVGARSVASKTGDGNPYKLLLIAAAAFTIVRLLMLLFGWKESANVGVRVSLSVLHIPAAIILQGFYFQRVWQRVTRHGSLRRPDLVAALAILAFVWVIPAAITSDIGLALLNVPLFVLLLLAVSRHARTHEGKWLARVLVALVVLFLAGGPIVRLFLPLVRSEEFLLSAASDSNYARFLHFAAPERLQEFATRRGESLAITSAILQSYISTGLFGKGYGHSDVSPYLGDTALRDFAPAVFVAAEWGLIGTLAALLLYLLFPVAARDWLPWSNEYPSDETPPGPTIAFLAAATIAVSSIYMILANHELLLLTGKNAYLLGLDSAGDVIETMVLALLIAYGSTLARDDDPRPYGGIA